MDVLESTNLDNEFNTLCKDKKNCTLMDFTFFIKGEGLGQNRTFEGPTQVINDCTKSSSRMFIQYMCKQDEE